MNTINMVIVPLWLNSIMGELGISDEDLVDCKKLSDILSPQDILIYKIVNQADKRNALFECQTRRKENNIGNDFGVCIPTPDVLESLRCREMSLDELVCGTRHAIKCDDTDISVRMINMDTVGVFYSAHSEETNVPKNKWIESLAELLHGRLGLQDFSKLNTFKKFVDIV